MVLKCGMRVMVKRVRRAQRIDIGHICRAVLLQMRLKRICVGEVIGIGIMLGLGLLSRRGFWQRWSLNVQGG